MSGGWGLTNLPASLPLSPYMDKGLRNAAGQLAAEEYCPLTKHTSYNQRPSVSCFTERHAAKLLGLKHITIANEHSAECVHNQQRYLPCFTVMYII